MLWMFGRNLPILFAFICVYSSIFIRFVTLFVDWVVEGV